MGVAMKVVKYLNAMYRAANDRLMIFTLCNIL